jgi:general secretion pathway protein D
VAAAAAAATAYDKSPDKSFHEPRLLHISNFEFPTHPNRFSPSFSLQPSAFPMSLSPSLALILIALLLPPSASLLAQTTATRSTTATTGRGNTSGGNTSSSSGSSSDSTVRQYRNNTMLGDAIVQIDPETRSLIVVADNDTQEEISKVIENLDRPKPQVLIKVLFAQVTLDKSLDVGLEGNYSFNLGASPLQQLLSGPLSSAAQSAVGPFSTSVATAVSGTSTTVTNTTTSPPTTLATLQNPSGVATNFGLASDTTGSFLRLNTANATATLYALAQKGDVNILSRPSILARNNQEAVIVVGQSIPLITSSQITEAGQTINTVQYQDVGIILRVTPFITSSRTVEMIVSPEISSLSSQTVPISNTVNAPVINKTSAETVVVTPDATTVVIGGMMQKQQTSSVNKVPILGDIPILGYAFRHTVKADSKTELLIFLTPYIVEGTATLKGLSAGEVNRTDLPDTAFKDDNLKRYLDTIQPISSPTPKPRGLPLLRGFDD